MTEPANPLLDFALGALVPFLIAGGLTDPAIALIAARQAIAAYQAEGHENLLAITQIASFTMASLDSLRLSATAEYSVSMKLKLRVNANSLNRSAYRGTPAVQAKLPQPDQPSPEADLDEAETLATLAQTRTELETAQPTPETAHQRMWANAMTDVAAEFARDLGKLPRKQRREEIRRIAALTRSAQHLTSGAGEHPPQQSILQPELMIQRPQNMQPRHPE